MFLLPFLIAHQYVSLLAWSVGGCAFQSHCYRGAVEEI